MKICNLDDVGRVSRNDLLARKISDQLKHGPLGMRMKVRFGLLEGGDRERRYVEAGT